MLTDKLKNHFLSMYFIALSDHSFSKTEMDMILKIGEEKGISKNDFEKIIATPQSIPYKIPENTIEKIEFLFDFARIIWADGIVEDSERDCLIEFCKKFDFEESAVELTQWLLEIAQEPLTQEELSAQIKILLEE